MIGSHARKVFGGLAKPKPQATPLPEPTDLGCLCMTCESGGRKVPAVARVGGKPLCPDCLKRRQQAGRRGGASLGVAVGGQRASAGAPFGNAPSPWER